MPPHLQKYFWRLLDHAMPEGPPFVLTLIVMFLLIVNGFIVFLR
jgi:hypothetical protein